jgi:hypothetical protein
LNITPNEVNNAFNVIRKVCVKDAGGIAVAALRAFTQTRPHILVHTLEKLMSATPDAAQVTLHGFVKGKGSEHPQPENLRAIVPLSAIFQIADAILAERLHAFIDSIFPEIDGVWIGARPHTQPLDIAHGIAMVIERGMDDRGRAGAAQCDIKGYYVNLSVLRIVLFLETRGLPRALAAAVVRQQMLPELFLSVGGFAEAVGHRSSGCLTGSRVAGALGRVPVEEIRGTQGGRLEAHRVQAGLGEGSLHRHIC